MTSWVWRRRLEQAEHAVREAERLRDVAQEQCRQVASIAPRVDTISASLEKLRTDNHFGPMIDKALRGGTE